MGVVFKQSYKGTIYTYLGVFLGFVTTGLLMPRIFSKEEVGLLKILVTYSALFAQFGTLGINGVAVRLFPFFQTEDKKHHGYLSVALLVGFTGFLLSMLVLFLIKPWLTSMGIEKSTLFLEYFNTLSILVFFQLFFYILDSYYAALMNSTYGTFLKEVFQRAVIIAGIVLYYYNYLSLNQFVWIYILAICLPTLNILVRLIRVRQFNLKTEWDFLDKAMVASMVSMSLFSILNGFSNVIIQSVDVFMLNDYFGLGTVGVYTICFFFGVIISLPARPITRIANIIAAQAWKNNDMEALKQLYYKSCMTLFIIGSILFLGLWSNIDNVFRMLPAEYSAGGDGKWVIFFIALGSLIDMSTGVNGSLMGTSKYFKVQTVFLLLLVVLIIVTNIILIPILGMKGVAVGNAISMTILNILRFWFLKHKYGLQPFNSKFLLVLLFGSFSYMLSLLIPTLNNYIFDILIRGSAVVLIFIAPVYFFKISEDINFRADKVLKRFGIIRS